MWRASRRRLLLLLLLRLTQLYQLHRRCEAQIEARALHHFSSLTATPTLSLSLSLSAGQRTQFIDTHGIH